MSAIKGHLPLLFQKILSPPLLTVFLFLLLLFYKNKHLNEQRWPSPQYILIINLIMGTFWIKLICLAIFFNTSKISKKLYCSNMRCRIFSILFLILFVSKARKFPFASWRLRLNTMCDWQPAAATRYTSEVYLNESSNNSVMALHKTECFQSQEEYLINLDSACSSKGCILHAAIYITVSFFMLRNSFFISA